MNRSTFCEENMRAKVKVLITWGIVPLAVVAFLSLAVILGQPLVGEAASALGLTPTPPSAPTPTFTPEATPVPPAPAPTPLPAPRLELTKTANRTEVSPGSSVRFTIRVCNVGNATADNVVVSDALAPELEVVSASVSQGVVVVEGNGVRAEFGALAPGECAELRIVARVRADVPPGTQITNVGTIPGLASNEVTVTVIGLLPASGGTAPGVVAGLLAVAVALLAVGLVLGVRARVLQ